MDSRINKWLFDILVSIEEIQQFLKSAQVEVFIDYQNNKMLKRATERNLEIIGEAMTE
ncbi:DUF86 domain-containing protein [Rhodonellum sp.]|uniref:HepT-like ribonuclease domain-containing protein n=1 Tax=Rhodonellum sp. TaxID=2231180 RepID=UPI00271F4BF0|nr:HepT-like ribonuclease domain-containing protein [Rhodonellum sp.]MDO9552177.1 DUF86 domain-containing protein [Rhodonellum sp.]